MHGRNELGRVASRNLLLGGLTDMRDDLLAGEMAILDRLREGTASNTGVPSLSRCWRSGRAGVPGAVSVVCCVARQTEMLQMLNHEREGRSSTVWMPEEARNTRTRSESRMQPLDRSDGPTGTFSRHNAWRGTWRVGLGLQTLDPGTRRRPYWPI